MTAVLTAVRRSEAILVEKEREMGEEEAMASILWRRSLWRFKSPKAIV